MARALVVGEKTLTEEELLQEGRVLVVLAEPGAGKTELLNALADILQTKRVKASVFRHKSYTFTSGPLVIDAMDEVARIDSAAIDQIVARASEIPAATVVFAGRSSEWDEGRTAYVRDCFGSAPTIVRLRPFDEGEQRRIFAERFPGEDFAAFVAEVRKFELEPLLGNPQFLLLFGEGYVEGGRAFTSKAKVFADAVQRLAHEANGELRRRKDRPPRDEIVALAGELFAKLLLAGAEGIATVEPLGDRLFPYLNGLCADVTKAGFLLDTRLLKPSDGTETHESVHRIVAEYCAAGYLAERTGNPGSRLSLERVLAVVAPNGVVRDELRGMLGWMAALGREELQLAAVRTDPYAVLANGDPGQLTAKAKRLLLEELGKLADADPMFRRSDAWRRFNVGNFFTADILDQVRAVLGKPGALRDLVVELLLDRTVFSASLLPELTALLKSPAAGGDLRRLVLQAMLGVPAYDPDGDLAELMAEGSPDALEIVARAVTKRGTAAFRRQDVANLLARLGSLYPNPRDEHRGGASLYFIDLLCRSFDAEDCEEFLDTLSAGLACTCSPQNEYSCRCRHGASKLAGKLLDRYFELSEGSHDPHRIWSWLKPLHFRRVVSGDSSRAVRYLGEETHLRRTLQQLSVQGATGREAARSAVTKLYSSYCHSGIRMHEGDHAALGQHAFDQGLVNVWAALLAPHDVHGDAKGPNPARRAQRSQARTSPAYLAAWHRWERSQQSYRKEVRKVDRIRQRRRYARQEASVEERNRAHIRQNLLQIEAGRHWSSLKAFAYTYLLKPDSGGELVDDPETPLRALRNCFPMLAPHVPSVESLGRGERHDIAEVLFAACVVRFRDSGGLDGIDPKVLAAAKTQVSSCPAFADGEEAIFEAAIDDVLFRQPGSAEAFVRGYLEQQLAATEEVQVLVHWLDHKRAFQHLRADLPLEWLDRFAQMPAGAARALFGMAVRHGNRAGLLAVIDRRLRDPAPGTAADPNAHKRAAARRRFWQVNAFLYQPSGSDAAWNELKLNPNVIFDLEDRLGRFRPREDLDRPPMTAEKVFQVMDAFVDVWPKVRLPGNPGSESPGGERAYRFLQELVWKVADDMPERRIPALDRIVADSRFLEFHSAAMTLRAEAVRKAAHQDFRPPLPAEINGMLDSNQVASVEDLRALMVEQLAELQRWLDGSETDPLDMFYSNGRRVDENTARNRIVERLQGRMAALGLSVVIERHMAGGNRCDITVSATVDGTNRLLVVEVKGQWNDGLYSAASAQLDERYAIHPDAARQGIYLVFWYGNGEKVAGHSAPAIKTAGELRDGIVAVMPVELRMRIDVVVIDLSRRRGTQPRPGRSVSPGRDSGSSRRPATTQAP